MRVGGNIATLDHSSNSAIAVFLDSGFVKTSTDYDSNYMNGCFSAIDSTVTCTSVYGS